MNNEIIIIKSIKVNNMLSSFVLEKIGLIELNEIKETDKFIKKSENALF